MENSCGSCGRSDVPLKMCVCKGVTYCGPVCQKTHWKLHKPNCCLFVVKEIAGRGKGMIATRRIVPGTVILREEPLLVVQHSKDEEDEESCSTLLRVWEAFGQLSTQKQKQFLSLSDCCDFGTGLEKEKVSGKVFGIYGTNSVAIGNNSAGVYWIFARINHSCAPNAVAFRNKANQFKELRAFVEIQKGEEIFISYLDLENCVMRDDRRKILSQKWKFTCQCRICSLTGQELKHNEDIRRQVVNCHEAMAKDWSGSLDKKGQMKALENARRKLELCEEMKDEMIGQVFSSLLDCYSLASVVRALRGKLIKQPEEYAGKAEAIARIMGDGFMEAFDDTVNKLGGRAVMEEISKI